MKPLNVFYACIAAFMFVVLVMDGCRTRKMMQEKEERIEQQVEEVLEKEAERKLQEQQQAIEEAELERQMKADDEAYQRREEELDRQWREEQRQSRLDMEVFKLQMLELRTQDEPVSVVVNNHYDQAKDYIPSYTQVTHTPTNYEPVVRKIYSNQRNSQCEQLKRQYDHNVVQLRAMFQ